MRTPFAHLQRLALIAVLLSSAAISHAQSTSPVVVEAPAPVVVPAVDPAAPVVIGTEQATPAPGQRQTRQKAAHRRPKVATAEPTIPTPAVEVAPVVAAPTPAPVRKVETIEPAKP